MNLSELQDLVVVRNHLRTLLNNPAVIPNVKRRDYEKIATKMDEVFLNNVAVMRMFGDSVVENISNLNTNEVIIAEPMVTESKQLELFQESVVLPAVGGLTKPKKKEKSAEPTEEEKAIADKIAKAKASIKTQKKAGGFKRTSTED